MSNEHDRIDEQIERALAEYSGAEPLAGLEERVLQRVRLADGSRRRVWWRWAAASGVLATLVVMVALLVAPRQQPAPLAKVAERAVPQVVPAPPPPPQETPRPAPAPRALPKQEQFPAPSPLTVEERALLALARSYPEEALKAPPERIEIAPIEIAPLQWDGMK